MVQKATENVLRAVVQMHAIAMIEKKAVQMQCLREASVTRAVKSYVKTVVEF
jgi:hypothetical protein